MVPAYAFDHFEFGMVYAYNYVMRRLEHVVGAYSFDGKKTKRQLRPFGTANTVP